LFRVMVCVSEPVVGHTRSVAECAELKRACLAERLDHC
jgi:hypothetical protein